MARVISAAVGGSGSPEAFVRLIYGRMDEAHTPPVGSTGVELDELRQIFPGF